MLTEGSHPPHFVLPDGEGKRRNLAAFLGRSRVIIVFGPDATWLNAVRAGRDEFIERDLTVLVLVAPDHALAKEKSTPPLFFLADKAGAVARVYGAESGATTFFLAGKDGTVKMAQRGCPTNRELFGVIDAMPMRRREMRERRDRR